MKFAAVDSTTLATVAYDEQRGLLRLEFCSRAVYVYFSVPAIVHLTLLKAPSKGSYFNQAIRGRFPYQRVCNGGERSLAADPVQYGREG